VVVLGGKSHKIYYNANDPNITAQGISSAISAALADNLITGVPSTHPQRMNIYYDRVAQEVQIVDMLPVKCEITDLQGRLVRSLVPDFSSGKGIIKINGLSKGVYLISVSTANGPYVTKLLVGQ
jgi:hypothetical protein